jgi:hypothetical protein
MVTPLGKEVLPMISKEVFMDIIAFPSTNEEIAEDMGEKDDFFIEITQEIFPRIPSHFNTRESELDKGPYVLIMSYLKRYHVKIMQIWRKAIEALKSADRLTIIGCSLRDEDIFLKFALHYFGMREYSNKFLIEIVDKYENAWKTIVNKIKEIVAEPDKQEFRFFRGLQQYLDK